LGTQKACRISELTILRHRESVPKGFGKAAWVHKKRAEGSNPISAGFRESFGKLRGTPIFHGRYLREARVPGCRPPRPDSAKQVNQTMRTAAPPVRHRKADVPRLKRNVKWRPTKRPRNGQIFLARGFSPPRVPARDTSAALPQRDVPRLHGAPSAARNGQVLPVGRPPRSALGENGQSASSRTHNYFKPPPFSDLVGISRPGMCLGHAYFLFGFF